MIFEIITIGTLLYLVLKTREKEIPPGVIPGESTPELQEPVDEEEQSGAASGYNQTQTISEETENETENLETPVVPETPTAAQIAQYATMIAQPGFTGATVGQIEFISSDYFVINGEEISYSAPAQLVEQTPTGTWYRVGSMELFVPGGQV